MLLFCEPPDVGAVSRRREGHRGDPPSGRRQRGQAEDDDLPGPAPERGGRGEQVHDAQRRDNEEGLQHLGEEPEAHQRAGEHEPPGLGRLERPNRGVDGAREEEGQQRIGVVEAEHEGGHRRQGHHGAPQQGGVGREPAPDGQVDQTDGGHSLQGLGNQHAPRVEAEDPARDLHDPQRGRRLVHGDEVGRVRGAEEEGLPALGARLDGRRIEGVGPPAGTEVPQVEHGGQAQQGEESGPDPGRVLLAATNQADQASPGRRGIRWGRPGDEGAGTGAGSAGLLLLVDRPRGAGMSVVMREASREWSDERAVGRKIQALRTAKREHRGHGIGRRHGQEVPAQRGTHQCLHREETQRGQGQTEDEEAGPHRDQAAPMGLSLHAVGQFPVHGEVEDGADGQGERVGPEGTGEGAPGHEEKEVAEGADGAHTGKAEQLVGRHLIDGRPW